MSSFTLLLMLSAFLRSSPNYLSAGHSLLAALHYYGHVFDPAQMAVVNDCIVLFRPDATLPGEMAALYVAHPFRPEVNVAYNVTRFEEIRACFRTAYARLIEAFQRSEVQILRKILCDKDANLIQN